MAVAVKGGRLFEAEPEGTREVGRVGEWALASGPEAEAGREGGVAFRASLRSPLGAGPGLSLLFLQESSQSWRGGRGEACL